VRVHPEVEATVKLNVTTPDAAAAEGEEAAAES
jgi:hypothetical protein